MVSLCLVHVILFPINSRTLTPNTELCIRCVVRGFKSECLNIRAKTVNLALVVSRYCEVLSKCFAEKMQNWAQLRRVGSMCTV